MAIVVRESTSTFFGLSRLIMYRESNPLKACQPSFAVLDVLRIIHTPRKLSVPMLSYQSRKPSHHAMSNLKVNTGVPTDGDWQRSSTDAIIFTLFPAAFCAISFPSFAARCSIEADAGTEAVMTSIPFIANASVMPLQYRKPGSNGPAMCNSSKPNRP